MFGTYFQEFKIVSRKKNFAKCSDFEIFKKSGVTVFFFKMTEFCFSKYGMWLLQKAFR